MAKQSKCTPAQLEALAKARAAAAQKKQEVKQEVKEEPKADFSELIDLVKSLKEDVATQFAEEMKAIDQLKVELENVKSLLPKKVDTSFLSKF